MIKRLQQLFLVILFVTTLSGCVLPLVAVVGGAAVGATSIIYDRRSIKTMMHDRDTTRIAQTFINQDKMLSGRTHISVSSFNHVILMVGQAQTPALRARAYALVERAPYARRIYNEVTIGAPTSNIQRTNDTWLTSKVKSAMLAKPGFRSSQIKVVTEASIVYLMGIVSRSQGQAAANIARRVPGVLKVVTLFQYIMKNRS